MAVSGSSEKTNDNDAKKTLQELASSVAQTSEHVAADVSHKAQDWAANVANKAQETATAAVEATNDGIAAVGHHLNALGGTFRKATPRDGAIGSAATTVADKLQSAGRYLEGHGLQDVRNELTSMVRHNPIQSVLVGFGLGCLLGMAFEKELTMSENHQADAQPGVASLVGGILDDAQSLVRQELALAQREVAQAWDKAKTGVALLTSAIAVCSVAGVLLGLMLVRLLQEYLLPSHEWVCFGIVGGLVALLGGALIHQGIRRINNVHVSLPQGAETMREDVQVVNTAVPAGRASTPALLKR